MIGERLSLVSQGNVTGQIDLRKISSIEVQNS